MIDAAFSVAFTLWDYTTTWIELIAVLLGIVMVFFTIAEQHWGWLFAILSSALYFLIFGTAASMAMPCCNCCSLR